MRNTIITVILLNFFIVGCGQAEITQPRLDYILAQDHGWVELDIEDNEVSANFSKNDKGEITGPHAPSCYISIKVNNEPFIRESIFTSGDEPPYKVKTGFRFPVPTGISMLDLYYSGCAETDKEGERRSTTSIELTIDIEMVSSITFDGTDLLLNEIEPNQIVTLEDIDNKLQQLNEKLGDNNQ